MISPGWPILKKEDEREVNEKALQPMWILQVYRKKKKKKNSIKKELQVKES